jgi:hypothetical protein
MRRFSCRFAQLLLASEYSSVPQDQDHVPVQNLSHGCSVVVFDCRLEFEIEFDECLLICERIREYERLLKSTTMFAKDPKPKPSFMGSFLTARLDTQASAAGSARSASARYARLEERRLSPARREYSHLSARR